MTQRAWRLLALSRTENPPERLIIYNLVYHHVTLFPNGTSRVGDPGRNAVPAIEVKRARETTTGTRRSLVQSSNPTHTFFLVETDGG